MMEKKKIDAEARRRNLEEIKLGDVIKYYYMITRE